MSDPRPDYTTAQQMRRALNALYLEAPESVARDVGAKVEAYVAELEAARREDVGAGLARAALREKVQHAITALHKARGINDDVGLSEARDVESLINEALSNLRQVRDLLPAQEPPQP